MNQRNWNKWKDIPHGFGRFFLFWPTWRSNDSYFHVLYLRSSIRCIFLILEYESFPISRYEDLPKDETIIFIYLASYHEDLLII